MQAGIGLLHLRLHPDPAGSQIRRRPDKVLGQRGLPDPCLAVPGRPTSGADQLQTGTGPRDLQFSARAGPEFHETITDVADGFLAAAIGGALLAVWAVARHTSRRLSARLARMPRAPFTEGRPQPPAPQP